MSIQTSLKFCPFVIGTPECKYPRANVCFGCYRYADIEAGMDEDTKRKVMVRRAEPERIADSIYQMRKNYAH